MIANLMRKFMDVPSSTCLILVVVAVFKFLNENIITSFLPSNVSHVPPSQILGFLQKLL